MQLQSFLKPLEISWLSITFVELLLSFSTKRHFDLSISAYNRKYNNILIISNLEIINRIW